MRRDQKPGDYRNPGWFKHPSGTQAYEFTGALPAATHAATQGTGSMPAKGAPAHDTEVQIRKPGGHSGHH